MIYSFLKTAINFAWYLAAPFVVSSFISHFQYYPFFFFVQVPFDEYKPNPYTSIALDALDGSGKQEEE